MTSCSGSGEEESASVDCSGIAVTFTAVNSLFSRRAQRIPIATHPEVAMVREHW
jgi:hypothetical protein